MGHWNDFGGYSARGFGGQYLFVIPEHDLVVVFTSDLKGYDYFSPENMVGDFILPSIKPDAAKNASTKSKKLQDMLKTIQQLPETKPIPELPGIAQDTAEKTMVFEKGEELYLGFDKDKDGIITARFGKGTGNRISIGLDNVYRISDAGDLWPPLTKNHMIAARGIWKDEKTFTFSAKSLHDLEEYVYTFVFNEDQVEVTFKTMQGQILMILKGKLKTS